ncbi:hypothetical protein D3C72_454900 [compost metagenome]
MHQGYYRFPTIAGDTIVFTCEDDLWRVDADGGDPIRLTAGSGESTHPYLSPDGQWLAFTGREEGYPEIYVMRLDGGLPRRLTYLGAVSFTCGWTPDGQVLFASNAHGPFSGEHQLYTVPVSGGEPRCLPWGPARHAAYGPSGGLVLGRNTGDPARWKRYRGGTAGELWIDPTGSGDFHKLDCDLGNPTTPMWIGDRIYFLADHEGIGNLYSCLPDGSGLLRHTDHDTYYARQATTDGRRIVYHAGADVFMYDPVTEDYGRVPIQWHASAAQTRRKFVDAARYLDDAHLHPRGHSVAIATRGKAYVMGNWAGPVIQLGQSQGVRYRLPAWLADGEQVAWVTDELGEESVVVFKADGTDEPDLMGKMDLGRVLDLRPSPNTPHLVLTNHRHELILIDLPTKTHKVLDRSTSGRLAGIAWSPDGRWVAYGFPTSIKTTAIKVANVETGETHQVTNPVLHDVSPAWDPKGRYLYFLSFRVFNPVYDNLHFDLGFPKGVRPCLVTLRADVPSPFVATVEPVKDAPRDDGDEDEGIQIDIEGIERRVVPFPMTEGRYRQILALDHKVMIGLSFPQGTLGQDRSGSPPGPVLDAYDFNSLKREALVDKVHHVQLSMDNKYMLLQVGDRLRVVPAGEKPKDGSKEPGKDTGWLDLDRIRVSIEPKTEWRQMYREAWRLQRDQYWTEDMASVDWNHVNDIYEPLLDRVATRAEFSDLLWEMQGELGTSHAYEYGGDYRPVPSYDLGLLGAHYEWDPEANGYRITRILNGDPGEPNRDSPLNRVGLDIRQGDVILAIGGQPLTETFTPDQALVHQAGLEVQLTVADRNGGQPRRVSVKALGVERPIRYREWVDTNRKKVHEATDGRIGYLHIPDMGAAGYAEFHRGFLVEAHRDGLIVDVRYNGGGHVSQLLLEKLNRRRLGYDVERWGAIKPYPDESIVGPMVAITNQHAGSDGDVFSHCFKLLNLGPLIGKRTWGGVVGVWPRHALVDGTLTTQPEFAFWFEDVGWSIENHGTEPDVEVDIRPQDWAADRDPQLERAIEMTRQMLEANPPAKPDFSKRPNLAPPPLPPRGDSLVPDTPPAVASFPDMRAAEREPVGMGGGGGEAAMPEAFQEALPEAIEEEGHA